MKKTMILLITILAGLSQVYAQNVTITYEDSTTNLSGQTHYIQLQGAVSQNHMIDFIIHNQTGNAQYWTITRRNVSEPADWSNYFCWGLNGQVGTCYDPYPDEYWTGSTVNIPADSSGRLSAYVSAPSMGCATYRYYVTPDGTTFLDSVDIQVCWSLGLEEDEIIGLTVAPNPSSNTIHALLENGQLATAEIYTIAGEHVFSVKPSKTSVVLNVGELQSGVYMLKLGLESGRVISRRIQVE